MVPNNTGGLRAAPTPLARLADMHLAIRPGSDLAVALAVQPEGWTTQQTLDLQAALPDFRYTTG